MNIDRCCPALVISAPASGQGKTSVTAALAAYHRQRGLKVRIFKIGPDFLDPMVLEKASDHPVYQIDLWMVGEQTSSQLLYDAAEHADLILIEGVMGLFDGDPSTADLAITFGIPVLAVIDGSAMAQTFAALAVGLQKFKPALQLGGVFANKVSSERHLSMITSSLPVDIPCYGSLPSRADSALPSRYLGLMQAAEVGDLDNRIRSMADQLLPQSQQILPPEISFSRPDEVPVRQTLTDVKIAVARDAAFSFIYQANLDLLEELGAELSFFSPLEDKQLPDADSLYFPGGYPELHLDKLSANKSMLLSIKHHYDGNKPILAECGGMLYFTESIQDKEGEQRDMLGILQGNSVLQKRLTALALQEVVFTEGKLRGHTYHHSLYTTDIEPLYRGKSPNESATTETVYQQKRLTASYIHFYFPSNPMVIGSILKP